MTVSPHYLLTVIVIMSVKGVSIAHPCTVPKSADPAKNAANILNSIAFSIANSKRDVPHSSPTWMDVIGRTMGEVASAGMSYGAEVPGLLVHAGNKLIDSGAGYVSDFMDVTYKLSGAIPGAQPILDSASSGVAVVLKFSKQTTNAIASQLFRILTKTSDFICPVTCKIRKKLYGFHAMLVESEKHLTNELRSIIQKLMGDMPIIIAWFASIFVWLGAQVTITNNAGETFIDESSKSSRIQCEK